MELLQSEGTSLVLLLQYPQDKKDRFDNLE